MSNDSGDEQNDPELSNEDVSEDGANEAPATQSKTEESSERKRIKYEAAMAREEAVSYFEAIVEGFRRGRLQFKKDEDEVVFSAPEQLNVEVKAARKGDRCKIGFEIEWRDGAKPNLSIVASE